MNGSKRITAISILLIVAGALFLSGCSKKDPLVATWVEPTSGISMQFKDDGNLVISNQKTSLTVAYVEQDPTTLVIKASSDGSYPGQTMLYRIEEDRLVLTVDNQETVFTRKK